MAKLIKNTSDKEIKIGLESQSGVIAPGASIVLPDWEASQLFARNSDTIFQGDQTVRHFSFLEVSEYTAPKEEPVKLEEKPKVEKVKKEKK